ncbi:Uma2 family endonuclease [Beijerinckia mobilis]|uniref:Uma2 family endonuclease n=1 Tax=Beijerinckia mobilis TaxID=231434 RepID=UPI00055932B0|nr:Uma2 family endonuclease [Beijerinckia mobilis]
MPTSLRKPISTPMTRAEFLTWEAQQPIRYEFDGYTPVAMAGGTEAHAIIQANLAAALVTRLRGKPCRFIGSDLKALVADNSSRYPDGMVVCSPVENKRTTVADPVIVFEVLSPSTASTDRIVKAREYQVTPSIQRYIMLEQDRIGATVYARSRETWTFEILADDAILHMTEIGVELPLAELYEGLTFDEAN